MRVREVVELCLEVQGGSVESSTSSTSRGFPWRDASAADYLPRSYGGVEEGVFPRFPSSVSFLIQIDAGRRSDLRFPDGGAVRVPDPRCPAHV